MLTEVDHVVLTGQEYHELSRMQTCLPLIIMVQLLLRKAIRIKRILGCSTAWLLT